MLIDFGLAVLEDDAALTGAGMCVGSPSYIAPERLLGRGSDARTDLYAVGVILYEMLAGVRPFAGRLAEETMHLALRRPPRPLRAMRRDVPRELETIVAGRSRRSRLAGSPTAEDMALALADVPLLEETSGSRSSAPRRRRPRRSSRSGRRRGGCARGAGCASAGGGGRDIDVVTCRAA